MNMLIQRLGGLNLLVIVTMAGVLLYTLKHDLQKPPPEPCACQQVHAVVVRPDGVELLTACPTQPAQGKAS